MTRTRLVALDVDGTLMSYDGVISPQVRDAVGELVGAGLHVVLATGRSVHATVPVARELGLAEGWLVCSNGAVTARLSDEEPAGYEITDTVTFDPGPALRAIALELPDALFAVENLGVGYRVSGTFPEGELSGETEVVTLDELAMTSATRVIIRAVGESPDVFHEIVERVGLHEVEYAIGWSAWLDLTPGGVSKASALESVRRALGVEPFGTLAIGDGGNDVAMLQWAARGVAMGHARPAVLAAADEVTGGIEDDGALPVLRSLLA
ncbi:HAD family hydrolase [Cellulomonas palmilytica]|uniref:HAD family hydrolase n=1 Tax=Cellulomonas palmilytica TaxID=2608402 RepID=UPI001F4152A8|nr:HAD family hydrolase [Cellulomonas palmilytica]UJP40773.1 HAD family phosphatase [Cellulomonas palmilytica]